MAVPQALASLVVHLVGFDSCSSWQAAGSGSLPEEPTCSLGVADAAAASLIGVTEAAVAHRFAS